MLNKIFLSLTQKYTTSALAVELWAEIENHYTGRERHYHTLTHLEHLLIQLTEAKDKIQNWDAVLFALFYHDVIYRPLKSNNEEKSAELAAKRMEQLFVSSETIQRCNKHILATKSHTYSSDNDTNYFTDADLSVLGQNWETYLSYCKNIRKEYSVYPDFLYNPGRKKVLQHFLSMPVIFKTEYFLNKFENTARKNLRKELENLG